MYIICVLVAPSSSPRGPCSPPATGAESEPIAATSSGRQPSLRRAEMLRFSHQPGPAPTAEESRISRRYIYFILARVSLSIFILSPLGGSKAAHPLLASPASRLQPGSTPGLFTQVQLGEGGAGHLPRADLGSLPRRRSTISMALFFGFLFLAQLAGLAYAPSPEFAT